jgi:Fe-S cluster assembly scaffold protein SufB
MSPLSAYLKECARRGEAALSRKSPLGPDIDLGHYREPPAGESEVPGLDDPLLREAALSAGMDLSGEQRSGTYLQVDHSVLRRSVREACEGQVEILPVAEALERDPRAGEYWWRAAAADSDKYTAHTAVRPPRGYYIRILPGCRVDLPLQSCLLLAAEGSVQDVHNIIVAGEGSTAQIITGCAVHPSTGEGLHVGVSEFYVGRGASLTFTMIHNWSPGVDVRPRSAAVVEEGGTFVSNYVLMRPVRSLQMCPVTTLRGARSRSRFQAIVMGTEDSRIDIGSHTVLEGGECSSEAFSRAIACDSSSIVARGRLVARTDDCRAHLECRGMIASRDASLLAVPELEAVGVPQAELSHEAAISPIAEEEVAYLMSRGMSREEALSVITRGFLNVGLMGLPPVLQGSIEDLIAATPAEGSRS